MAFHGDIEVPIRLDKNRHLKFTYAAYARFKRLTGLSINQVFERADEAQKKFPLPDEGEPDPEIVGKRGQAFVEAIGDDLIPTLLWAGLLHEDKTLSLETVEEACEYAEGDSHEAKTVWIFQKVLEAICLSKGITLSEANEASKKKKDPERVATATNGKPESGLSK